MSFPLTCRIRTLQLAAVCSAPILIAGLWLAVTLSGTLARIESALVGRAVGADLGPATDGARASTTLADSEVVLVVVVVAVALLALLRHWRGALTVVLSLIATELVVGVLKGLVERPRPVQEGLMADAGNFSFPSGHAATAVAVYAVLTLVAARALRGAPPVWRFAVASIGACLVLAVGGSRVLLGVHYPTDVMAGWLTGAAIALAVWWSTERISSGPVLRPHPAL